VVATGQDMTSKGILSFKFTSINPVSSLTDAAGSLAKATVQQNYLQYMQQMMPINFNRCVYIICQIDIEN